MTNLSKSELKKTCKDILTNVLAIAANNLVMEAAVCFDSAGIKPDNERDREKELDTYIRAINGELNQAMEQALIYMEELVFEPLEETIEEMIENAKDEILESRSYTYDGYSK